MTYKKNAFTINSGHVHQAEFIPMFLIGLSSEGDLQPSMHSSLFTSKHLKCWRFFQICWSAGEELEMLESPAECGGDLATMVWLRLNFMDMTTKQESVVVKARIQEPTILN